MPQQILQLTPPAPAARPRQPLAPAPLRALFAVLGRLAPAAAARVATRQFFRTRSLPPRAEERAVLATAQRAEIGVRGQRLAVYAWGEGPVALLVHGWNGSAAQMTPFVAPLRARGLRVVAFDAVGHGASTGERTCVPEMAEAVAAVSAAVGPVAVLVAHSAGVAAAGLAIRAGLRAERLAAVAPSPRPGLWIELFERALALPPAMRPHFLREVERFAGVRLQDIDLCADAAALALPVLVVHDADDGYVPVSDGRRLAAALPDARFRGTRGLGHRRILADPEVLEAVTRFCAG